MNKIPDSFSGYLEINDDEFAYFVSDSIVTLMPTQDNIDEVHERVFSMNTDTPSFIYGKYCDCRVAFCRNNKFNRGIFRINPSIRFSAPLIIMAARNTVDFHSKLTESWDKFHAITFCGGNINSVFPPAVAIKREKEVSEHDGTGKIEFAPGTAIRSKVPASWREKKYG